MSKIIYEVTLSPDGKHSVSVRSDDPLSLKDALPLAKKIQEGLLGLERSETPPTPLRQPSIQEPDRQQPQAPLCDVHATPMVQVNGRRGPFWSCHKTNLDGSWCTFRPGRVRPRSTPPAYGFPAG